MPRNEQPEGDTNAAMMEQAKRFVASHPEFGIIFLLPLLVPILSRTLPTDSATSALVFAILILLFVPAAFRIIRDLVSAVLADGLLRRALLFCFTICLMVFMLGGTAIAALVVCQQTQVCGLSSSDQPGPLTQQEIEKGQRPPSATESLHEQQAPSPMQSLFTFLIDLVTTDEVSTQKYLGDAVTEPAPPERQGLPGG